MRRIYAAELLGIKVVSPLWLEQSREARIMVPEADFLVNQPEDVAHRIEKLLSPISLGGRHAAAGSGGQAGCASSAMRSTSNLVVEPVANRAKLARSIDSPFFSSSQRYSSGESNNSSSHGGAFVSRHGSSHAAEQTAAVKQVRIDPAAVAAIGHGAGANTGLTETAAQEETAPEYSESPEGPAIPLPTFREYVAPVISSPVLKRRRSERISDLGKNSCDDLDFDDDADGDLTYDPDVRYPKDSIEYYIASSFRKRKKASTSSSAAGTGAGAGENKNESYDAVLQIPVDAELPIVYIDGNEGDSFPPPPPLRPRSHLDAGAAPIAGKRNLNSNSNNSSGGSKRTAGYSNSANKRGATNVSAGVITKVSLRNCLNRAPSANSSTSNRFEVESQRNNRQQQYSQQVEDQQTLRRKRWQGGKESKGGYKRGQGMAAKLEGISEIGKWAQSSLENPHMIRNVYFNNIPEG